MDGAKIAVEKLIPGGVKTTITKRKKPPIDLKGAELLTPEEAAKYTEVPAKVYRGIYMTKATVNKSFTNKSVAENKLVAENKGLTANNPEYINQLLDGKS